jgi:hypothetical protein
MANNEKSSFSNKNEPKEFQKNPILEDSKEKKYIFATNKWRVKLYNLNGKGQWDDSGIGYVFCAYEAKKINTQDSNEENALKLIMLNEETDGEMFNIDIKKESIEFHNQRGIIITWQMGNVNEDNTAISFQEKEGVIEIWNKILVNQGKNPLDKNNLILADNHLDSYYLDVSIQSLPNLFREFGNDMNEQKINYLVSFLKKTNYEFILKLGELLKDEEKKLEEIKSSISTETNYTVYPSTINENPKKYNEDNAKENKTENNSIYNSNNQISLNEKNISNSPHMENINHIFNIFKNLILLGNRELIEILLNDTCYLITFGALEYNFELGKIVPHRKYFKEVVKFKNPLNIEEVDILQKINLNVRLSYLKDTALPIIIDSNYTTKNIISLIQNNNNGDIINFFINEEKYLDLLCDQMQDKNLVIKNDSFSFFSELLKCTKDKYQEKVTFNEAIYEMGLFQVIAENLEEIINNKYVNSWDLKNFTQKEIIIIKEKIINVSIETITNFLLVLPNEFNMVLKCGNLINQFNNLMLYTDNFGIKYEISCIFKMLIEINYQNGKFDNFNLYNESFESFIKYLKMPIDQNKKYEISTTKQIILEIFIYLFNTFNFDSQFWLNQNELDKLILNLLEDNNKIIIIYTIKLLKCLINNSDLSVCTRIFSKQLCDKLIQIFIDNIKNTNIIISCLIGFFEDVNKSIDPKFNIIINKEKEFFTNSEYKIYFKNINKRIEKKPKEEKQLINYIDLNTLKNLLPKIQNNNSNEIDENQINNSDNNINCNYRANCSESKYKLLEKKRKRYNLFENDIDKIEYYSDEYLNEYEDIENYQKKRKPCFSMLDEEEEFDNLYDNIIDNENKINLIKRK